MEERPARGLDAARLSQAAIDAADVRGRVDAIPPGRILTKEWEDIFGGDDLMWPHYERMQLLKRHGRAEEIAAAVAFLASDEASFIAGATLDIGGGAVAKLQSQGGHQVLSPFDDYPIHPSADPIAHTASGDANHYDRYWFNGHQKNGAFYFGAAMAHYPVRGVIDAAFSLVRNGVEHSIFASGAMPTDRSTVIGPIRIEVVEPIRTIRYVVEPNEHSIACDLTFRATTVAVEEPRQKRLTPEGVLLTDHTRLTQWGTWEGTIVIDGDELRIDPTDVPGTRDRSWGVRPVGEQLKNQRQPMPLAIFWLWAPLHFDDYFTHLAVHEHPDGTRWLESALVLEPMPEGAAPWSTAGVRECRNIRYDLEFEPGRREMRSAKLWFDDPVAGEVHIELEKVFTFRMRGIGYWHPHWLHGSLHGELETGRESIKLDDFDPLEFSSIHIQNLVIAKMGGRTGVGVLEEIHLGPHEPTGLTGLLDGYGS